jgi:hypothetical protein
VAGWGGLYPHASVLPGVDPNAGLFQNSAHLLRLLRVAQARKN